MHPVFLRFADASTERRFRHSYDPRVARSTRVALLVGAPGYVLMALILDDGEARSIAWSMVAVLVLWIVVSWSPAFLRRPHAVNVAAEALVSALSLPLVLALPAAAGMIVAIAYVTLNLVWIFVFLRPRVVYAFPLGASYVIAVSFVAAVVWDSYGRGDAPAGFVSILGGRGGGALVIVAYVGFVAALNAFIAYRFERAERVDFQLREELAAAHAQSERLLTNVLPRAVADRLKADERPIADDHQSVSVLFADIAGFTTMSSSMRPAEVLGFLNEVFTRFDDLALVHGLEKIKTIGDAYMAVAGAPEPVDEHACAAVAMGLDMLRAARSLRAPDGSHLQVRVGVGSGAAVAGVIGTRKFSYDLWGDTVNTASRMESHGIPGFVQIDETTRRLVADTFACTDAGTKVIKGKGAMRTWLLGVDP